MNASNNLSLRICVIGAGGHSQFHGQALARIRSERPNELQLAAVCDLDAARDGGQRKIGGG